MAERYTFEELKNLNVGTIFWKNGEEHKLTSTPEFYESDFYGEKQGKLEFYAVSEVTNREIKYVVADTEKPFADEEFLFFKTPTSHPIKGSSPLQPRADTETSGGNSVEEMKYYADMKKDGEIEI